MSEMRLLRLTEQQAAILKLAVAWWNFNLPLEDQVSFPEWDGLEKLTSTERNDAKTEEK